MNFKKIGTSLLLLATLVLSCGKKEEAPVSTNALTGSIVVQAEEAWIPHYEAAAARVKEKHPDVNIEIKSVGSFDHLEIIDKTDASNTDVADVFAIPLDRFEGLHQKDVLAQFDAKALADKVGGFSNYDKGLGGNLIADGNYYGFPFNIETLILGINKVNLEANNIELENVDFATLSPSIAMMPVFNAWWGVSVTNAFGVELLGKDGDKFFSDLTKDWSELSPEVQSMFEGLHQYWKAANMNKLPIFDSSAVYGYMDSNFKTGEKGSLRVIGPWDLSGLSGLIGEDLNVLGLNKAKFAGKELKHWQGGWALVINSRNEEDANKLAISEEMIAEIMNPAFAADLYKYTSKIMPNVTKAEYEKLDLPELDKKAIISVLDSFEGAVSRPLFKEWGQVWSTWENALLSWESKKPATAEDAYKEVQASFKSLLTNLGQ